MNKNIILVGFMATGKTTIGRLLANNLGFDFIDTDQLIEVTERTSIDEIFSLKGEAYFREIESKALDQLRSLEGAVISTGGGMVISPQNRTRLKNLGKVIYLKAGPKWVLANLSKSNVIRPILKNVEEPIHKITELLDQRKDFYLEVSDFEVSVDDKNIDEIIYNIVCKIKSGQ